MEPIKTSPKSLFDAWNCYIVEVQTQQSERQAYMTIARTKTAIIRYLLPYWGLPPFSKTNLTRQENGQALDFMRKIELEQLQLGLVAQDHVFKANQIPDRLQRTYRAALNRFLLWCQKQDWFQAAVGGEPKLVQPLKPPKRSAEEIRKNKRNLQAYDMPYEYALGVVKGDVINPKLQRELNAYRRFRLAPDLPAFKPVKPITVDQELATIHQVLGWLYRFCGVSNDELSLNCIAPYAESNSPDAEKATQQGISLVSDYITWLQTPLAEGGRGSTNKHYELEVMAVLLNVARFIYRHEVSQNQSIALIQALKKLKRQQYSLSLQQSEQRVPANAKDRVTEWKEVLAIVEHLRSECLPRALLKNQTRKQPIQYGHLRPLTAIAQSYQKFLLFALMSYIPPNRPQVYRNLIIKQDNVIPQADWSGYLYQNDKSWYMSFWQDAKADPPLKIPNFEYPDGRCFYQYLQEWLIEYVYIDPKGDHYEVNGLRQAFEPQHPYLFTRKNGERYKQTTELTKIVRETSYGITGKTLALRQLSTLFNAQIQQSELETSEVARRLAQKFIDSYPVFE
jgi:hypothetical protein